MRPSSYIDDAFFCLTNVLVDADSAIFDFWVLEKN